MKFDLKTNFNWKYLLIVLITFMISAGIIGSLVYSVMNEQAKKEKISTDLVIVNLQKQIDDLRQSQINKITESTVAKIIKYEIIYKVDGDTDDVNDEYYVLIDSIDLSSDNFKNNIKAVVKKIVSEKGNEVTINIFDKESVLDLYYKEQYDLSALTETEKAYVSSLAGRRDNERIAHWVANYYTGEDSFRHFNSLMFFPNSPAEWPVIGKYSGEIEFDPQNFNMGVYWNYL